MATSSKPEGQAPVSDEEQRKIKEYAEFMAKMKRTVYIDHLSPQVTEAVIKTALGQVGQVERVEFLPNQVLPYANLPQAALVEMESEKKAKAVISTLSDLPFMISGMPRPVRAQSPRPEWFPDRPTKPDKSPIRIRWVTPHDEDSDNIKRLELMARRHQAERLALIKTQLEVEEKLANQGQELLTANYKKYDIIDKSIHDSTIPKLAGSYGINLSEDI